MDSWPPCFISRHVAVCKNAVVCDMGEVASVHLSMRPSVHDTSGWTLSLVMSQEDPFWKWFITTFDEIGGGL